MRLDLLECGRSTSLGLPPIEAKQTTETLGALDRRIGMSLEAELLSKLTTFNANYATCNALNSKGTESSNLGNDPVGSLMQSWAALAPSGGQAVSEPPALRTGSVAPYSDDTALLLP